MKFETKIVIVVDEDLPVWQKLNVTAFLMSGIIGATEGIIGVEYVDGSGKTYLPLCIQPVLVMKTNRARLKTILQRANRRNIPASIYIEDMFSTGFDEANRETVLKYASEELPLVGIAVRGERKIVDKVVKRAKLHD